MMQYQVERAREYFNAATASLNREDKKVCSLQSNAAYLLQDAYKIVDADYDVYHNKIKYHS